MLIIAHPRGGSPLGLCYIVDERAVDFEGIVSNG